MRMTALVTCLAFGLAATPASAALVDITWTGKAYVGDDNLGLFGTPGSLVGQSYVAQYRYDTSIGFRSGADYQVVESDNFNLPNVSPLVSARITINGSSVSVIGDYNNLYYRSNAVDYSEIATFVTGRTSVFNDFNRLNVDFLTSGPQGDAVTIDLNAPYAQTFDPNDGVNGTFLYYAADNSNYSFAALTGETLTITLAGGVPEPASWAMLIAGFGLVGTAMRRRPARVQLA